MPILPIHVANDSASQSLGISLGNRCMKQAQPSGNVGNRFKPGQSGNPRGSPTRAKIRARIEEHARLLAEEYGGWSGLTEIERTMLIQTATLLWSRPTTAYD